MDLITERESSKKLTYRIGGEVGVVRRSKAYSTHVHSRTINCHCAYPTPDCHIPFVGRERTRNIDVCTEPTNLFREQVASHRFKVRERTGEDGEEEVDILSGSGQQAISNVTAVTCSFPECRSLINLHSMILGKVAGESRNSMILMCSSDYSEEKPGLITKNIIILAGGGARCGEVIFRTLNSPGSRLLRR
jgi:hypothetical protein